MSASESSVSEEEIKKKWPLHWLVWNDEHRALDRLLGEKEHDHEQVDPRGRTPLHLAATLKRVRCADVLLSHGANTLALNRQNWSVLNEAVCGGNPELIGMVLRHRDQQQARARSQEIPVMLEKLQRAPDFYIEMKWEFGSWVPLLSRMCPSDTYKIWKKGTSVRVDTTLIGFQQFNWLRGNLSFVFRGTATGAHVSEINHDRGTVLEEEFRILEPDPVQTLMAQEVGVVRRMNSPVISTVVDTDSVAFQRQKSGIWGFRTDKVETIDGYPAKVFAAAGLDIVTRTRVEHLPEAEKSKHKSVSPLQDFLGGSQDHVSNTLPALPGPLDQSEPSPAQDGGARGGSDSPQLSMEDYFTPPKDPKEFDAICRPPEVSSRVQTLKATVWLAEDYPLSLQEQMMPIIELMALNNAHFAKLKDFITLQMPAGFPVKFEIPLFHVMSAKVTFGNLNGHNQPAPHISLHTERLRAEPQPSPTPSASVSEGGGAAVRGGHVVHRHPSGEGTSVDTAEGSSVDVQVPSEQPSATVETEICTISEECFGVPPGYRRLRRGRGAADEEEELLQLAIQQSLMDQEGGGGLGSPNEEISLTEALNDRAVLEANDPEMQSAIRASLGLPPSQPPPSPMHPSGPTVREGMDPELELALALSRQQAEQEEEERQRREEEELDRVLRLSLEDQ